MAKIRKRKTKNGVSWQIDYFDPSGKRVRLSYKRKKQAEAELGKRVSLMAENNYSALDIKPEYKTTLGHLCDTYAEQYQDQKSFKTAKRWFIPEFKDYFGEDTLLANIGYAELEKFQKHLKRSKNQHGRPLTPATINKKIGCFKHMFKRGKDWKLVTLSH